MPLPVSIDALAEELDALPEDARVYLNRKTGEFITVPNHDMGVVEQEGENEDGFEWEWNEESLPPFVRSPRASSASIRLSPASGPSRMAIATARFNSITGEDSTRASKS